MDSMVRIYLNRADNEILTAECLKKLSEDDKDKQIFNLPSNTTFYSGVISHSYYAIFYSVKGLLLTKDIQTSLPDVHKKTYDYFKQIFVETGILDVNFLHIYKKIIIKSDSLLQIFKDEKWKRGHFTYKTISQANKQPAEESLDNAKFFVSNIARILRYYS